MVLGKRKRITRRKPRKKSRAIVMKRWVTPQVHRIKRTQYYGTWAFGIAATDQFWRYFTFQLSNVTNSGEFGNLFDLYRIRAVKVTFRPSYDMVVAPTNTTINSQPEAYAHVVIDPGSTVFPTGTFGTSTLNSLMENNPKTYTLNKPFSVYLKPALLTYADGAGNSAALMKRSTWIRTSDGIAQYRGFHVYLQPNAMTTTNVQIRLDMYYTFYMEFKGLR